MPLMAWILDSVNNSVASTSALYRGLFPMKFQLPFTVPLPASFASPFTFNMGVPRLIACGKLRPNRFPYVTMNAPGSSEPPMFALTAPNKLELLYDTPLLANLVRITMLGSNDPGASVEYPSFTLPVVASNDVLIHEMVCMGGPPTQAMFLAFSAVTRAATNAAPVRYVPFVNTTSIGTRFSFTPPTDSKFPAVVSTRNRAFLFFSDTLGS